MPDTDWPYVALDPGEKRMGYACFDLEGQSKQFGVFRDEDEMLDWLASCTALLAIIVESYRARPGLPNAWSRLPTVQQIGAIKREARKLHVPVIEQDPNPGLVMGLRFIGMHVAFKGKHVPDEFSALAHGTYYLRKERIQK